MTESSIETLRQRLDSNGLMAKKSFGQHFLLDLNITRKIARLGGPYSEQVVLEIGPGPGGLTQAILEQSPAKLIAIEKDSRFVEFLQSLQTIYPRQFSIVEGDALKIDETKLLEGMDYNANTAHIISNLPYNIGTPLLLKWLTGPFRPLSMTLMFQLEVARRIVAPVGSNDYGRLSVICQLLCNCHKIMDLPARAFTPPPKVDSAVVRLSHKPDSLSNDVVKSIERVTAAAFGQRRKMLRASLKPLGGETLLNSVNIDPTLRAEQISPVDFLKIAEMLL